MGTLTSSQISAFHESGVLVVDDAVSAAQLTGLRAQFDAWVSQSRQHNGAYGETIDGRARFDLESGHSADKPALRRVNSPTEVSDVYLDVMRDSRMVDCVTDLIGPNVRHHHNKINSKLPGAATAVKWHQDFPFTPHSNTDLVTALVMVDEVTEENGPLQVAEGSHKGPLHSLWHGGQFTGAIEPAMAAEMEAGSTVCKGRAGSVCLMHTCVAHGSAPNLSRNPRTLFICVYSAGDAVPCSPNPVPSRHAGMIVRGTDPGTIRSESFALELPKLPTTASFFDQQTGAGGQ